MSKIPLPPPERLWQTVSLEELSDDQRFKELTDFINKLIREDFDQLVQILYRMDVSEPKLKKMLAGNPDVDAGKLIAQMMIDRQAEKIRTRQQFRQSDENDTGEERW